MCWWAYLYVWYIKILELGLESRSYLWALNNQKLQKIKKVNCLGKQGCGCGSELYLEVGSRSGSESALEWKAGSRSRFRSALKSKFRSFRGSKWSRGGSVDQCWQICITLMRSRIRIRILNPAKKYPVIVAGFSHFAFYFCLFGECTYNELRATQNLGSG